MGSLNMTSKSRKRPSIAEEHYMNDFDLDDHTREAHESRHSYYEITDMDLEYAAASTGYVEHPDEEQSSIIKDKHEVLMICLKKALNSLTPKQRVVIDMLLEGKTQIEVANILQLNQSTVSLTIHGSYNSYSPGIRYGGILKKLRKSMVKQLIKLKEYELLNHITGEHHYE